jgi:hypothetical protein
MRVTPALAGQVWELVVAKFQLEAEREKYFRFIINCKKSYSFQTPEGESITWTNVWPDRVPYLEYKGTSAVLDTHVAAANATLAEIFSA